MPIQTMPLRMEGCSSKSTRNSKRSQHVELKTMLKFTDKWCLTIPDQVVCVCAVCPFAKPGSSSSASSPPLVLQSFRSRRCWRRRVPWRCWIRSRLTFHREARSKDGESSLNYGTKTIGIGLPMKHYEKRSCINFLAKTVGQTNQNSSGAARIVWVLH